VLGVACGSLGALAAVRADSLDRALDRALAGDWLPRRLPALAIRPAGDRDGPGLWAVNDFVVVRRGAGQVMVDLHVDDELYASVAGDGVVVATPVGSSAYSMAAGGPLLAIGTPAVVCTPVSMHGGNAPALVVPASSEIRVGLRPGWTGFAVEVDGHLQALDALDYRLSVHDEKVTLMSFGERGLGLTSLRERGLIADSPRVLAQRRYDREGA
jgi:NAD+ kinase